MDATAHEILNGTNTDRAFDRCVTPATVNTRVVNEAAVQTCVAGCTVATVVSFDTQDTVTTSPGAGIAGSCSNNSTNDNGDAVMNTSTADPM